jgi:hypothetical protein
MSRFAKKPAKKAQPTLEVPSLYGSHESMIDEELQEAVSSEGWVSLRDEKGVYSTTRDRLDSGLADPRRYDSERVIETPNVKAVVKK